MTVLYTINLVCQAAEEIGDENLVKKYFAGDQESFDKINAILKDACYETD